MAEKAVERFIDVAGGARLRTRASGPAGKPAMLFLHGGGTSLDDFDALTARFGDVRCVAVDTRGHGGSTLGTLPLRYPLLADDAETVLAAYDLTDVLVVGHSDGGIAALHLAARRCPRVRAIVTIGADAEAPDDQTQALYRAMTADTWRARFPEGVAQYERRNPQPDFDRLFDALRDLWLATQDNYPAALVASIACPALILGGDADHLVPRAVTVALADTVPTAALGVVPFGGHVLHQDMPDLVAGFIRRFRQERCDLER